MVQLLHYTTFNWPMRSPAGHLARRLHGLSSDGESGHANLPMYPMNRRVV